MSPHESVFTLEATPIKFGPGAVDDAGWELKRLGVSRALLVTDPASPRPGIPTACASRSSARESRSSSSTASRVEPELDSFQEAADFALDAGVDGFVSVGGGSAIDTAKVADLIVTPPGAGDGRTSTRRSATAARRPGR